MAVLGSNEARSKVQTGKESEKERRGEGPAGGVWVWVGKGGVDNVGGEEPDVQCCSSNTHAQDSW